MPRGTQECHRGNRRRRTLGPGTPDIPANGEKPIAAESGKVGFGPDPRELMTVTLGSSNADPKMHCSAASGIVRCRSHLNRSPRTNTS